MALYRWSTKVSWKWNWFAPSNVWTVGQVLKKTSSWYQRSNEIWSVTSVNWQIWDVVVNEIKISSTAPSSPVEWLLWYDTTIDMLKAYNWTWRETIWLPTFDSTPYTQEEYDQLEEDDQSVLTDWIWRLIYEGE